MSYRTPPMTPRKQRVLELLAKQHAISVPEIADALDEPLTSVRVAVRRLVQSGQVRPLGISATGARCYGLPLE